MEKGIIITMPRYDDTTEYLSQWSYEILDKAEERHVKVKSLKDDSANKEEFEKVIKKLNYSMVILNGHGSESCVFGHKDNMIIESGKNDSILINRINYVRSCNAAVFLGGDCMKHNKNGCFIGYNVPFFFYIDYKWVTNPRKDNIAGLFLSSSNLVPISLIKGNSAIESHQKARIRMLKNIKKVLKEKTSDSFLISEALWNNYIGQVLIGNKDAML